ncbi:MAG: hypothetical protein LBS74_05955 [Oscillospiraceae bacterium]|jgi:cyclic beta-1,2-glucan synthetase|nr:hypothetical protein [Oscillospiraceae bacterium]
MPKPLNITSEKPERLSSRTAKELEALRREYRRLAGAGSTQAGWLSDNFYMLEREGRMVIRILDKAADVPCKGGVPCLFTAIFERADLETGELFQEDARNILNEESRKRPLCTAELDLLPWLLRAVLISNACKALQGKSDSNALGNSIRSLRGLSEFDFESICEEYNAVDTIFRGDPAGVYPLMDRPSRAKYREKLAKLAKKRRSTEEALAKELVKRASKAKAERERHVGFYLLEDEAELKSSKGKGAGFLLAQCLIPALATVLLCLWLRAWPLLPIMWLALWEALRPLISLFQPRVEPRILTRMELNGEIPENEPTAVVVSNLLPSAQKAGELSSRLENLYITNGKGNIMFGILADFKGAKTPTVPEDRSALNAAVREISKLNEKYGKRFFLIVRERSYSKTQNTYSGWERKRGAITELVRLIKGRRLRLAAFEGDMEKLRQIKHIIALDADTRLLMGSSAELIAAAIHPLNRPVIDAKSGRVLKGYGILSPKIGTDLTSAGRTAFSRIMSGVRGVSPYGGVCGDVYQDFFGSGIFSGKGVINVEAFYALMDKAFPEECVLSHDILEGGILRTGYLSDVEMIDGVPSRASAWLSRQHRWIRGDWQNLRWAFKKDKLSKIGRYQLFDNLRRSLIEPIALILLVCSAFYSGFTAAVLAVIAIFSVTAPGWFAALHSAMAGGTDMLRRRYYSSVMSDTRAGVARGLVAWILLPAWAVMATDAIFRSAWRQLFSKKNLLEWTTAADSDKKSPASAMAKALLPPVLIGVLMFGMGTTWIHRLSGCVFICCILVYTVLSKENSGLAPAFGAVEKERIYSWAAAMWHFYEEYCNAAEHHLPPDNVQEAPVSRIAHRTSPTNIGLYLISVLVAKDFGFIEKAELAHRIGQTLDTIKALPKWNGNLYNWYNTRNLSILTPAYVSAVDSGNFAVAMVALKEGLKELGLDSLAATAEEILNDIDLAPFYNSSRKLFHIGYDCESGSLSNSFYDLLMSEARGMSYYAVAKKQVPRKHWGALGRLLARKNGHLGAVSWTGTMFEYYMPQLFLPVYEGSLSYESLLFAQHCQQRRGELWGVPWGISESGFYAFDGELNYQYKAHGVQKLGLKRGLDDDLVISPYSSFLLLPFAPEASMDNLNRLEREGMTGRCGFYEAADYTPSRRGNRPYAPVRSYMAHHVGMSIIACANTMFDNIIQARFMRDKEMHAASELLEERVPSGAIVFEDEIRREVPEKPGHKPRQVEGVNKPEPSEPKLHLLSNGEWTLAAADTGVSQSSFRNIDVNVSSDDILRRPEGFFALIGNKGESFSITAAPDYNSDVQRRTEFAPDYVAYYANQCGIEGIMKASVHPTLSCEERRIIVKNSSTKAQQPQLLLYLEPALAERRSFFAHPAFAKLFIEPCYDEAANAIIFEKRPRSNEQPVFLAVGLSSSNFKYDTSRERVLERSAGIFSLENAFDKEFKEGTGIPDPCFAVKFALKLAAKEEFEVKVWLCAASTRHEALRILAEAKAKKGKNGAVSPFDGLGLENRLAPEILSSVLFGGSRDADLLSAVRSNIQGVQALWAAGISGDFPIILTELEKEEDMLRAELCIHIHSHLRACGISSDLVFTLKNGGDYLQEQLSKLRKALSLYDSERLLGLRGGVHCVDLSRLDANILEVLRASACYRMPVNITEKRSKAGHYSPIKIQPAKPLIFSKKSGRNAVEIKEKPKLPWCIVLANDAFGTLISDCGLGFSWAVNARENKLTPWYNDTRSDNGGELLLFRQEGCISSLTEGAHTVFNSNKAEFFGELGRIQSKTEITIAEKGCVKYCDITLKNTGTSPASGTLVYYTEPVLGVNRSNEQRHLASKWEQGNLIFRNAFNTAVPGVMLMKSSEESRCTCSREAFWSGRWDELMLAPLHDVCGAIYNDIKLAPNEEKHIRYTLAWAANEQAAMKLAELDLQPKQPIAELISIKTPDGKLDDMVNTWLPQQFINSRFLGRSGFYQCGGAWGFRDQLQDSCALLYHCPERTRRHILRAAAKQFKEGDVLHWWHALPKSGGGLKGVRTLCSDDYLWLPYTVCEYIKSTGDVSILEAQVPFIEGEALGEEHEKYISPTQSRERASIREHCLRALKYGMQRTGEHGLPLMGNGDWNDGMNLVGTGGRGESVWLGMFLALVLERFSCYSSSEEGTELQEYAVKLKALIDEHCWDGSWYLRAFYDNGRPMGSSKNRECRIDSLPQSFSVLADMPNKERAHSALSSAIAQLVDWEHGVIKLFDPPFDGHEQPGYIAAYNPGLRENGGQYTHAAIWLAIAALSSGLPQAYRLIQLLLPQSHRAEVYQAEPYALAADIYAYPGLEGRAGWTQYTGAAGWYYRAIVQELLGVNIRGESIEFKPKIPRELAGTKLELKLKGTNISVVLTAKPQKEKLKIPLDGKSHTLEI